LSKKVAADEAEREELAAILNEARDA